jgi:hypothetical protein
LTLVLLDTNAYLRLARRIKPRLGVKFGLKEYILTILKQVEDEVYKNPNLQFYFPWFNDPELVNERLATLVRVKPDEKARIEAAKSVLHAYVLEHADVYTSQGRSPPSHTDCYILAFGQIRPAIVVTDDLGMHALAREFGLPVWHGHELLKKMLGAKMIENDHIRAIYEALEINDDLPRTWREAKHSIFKKIFGAEP